MKSAFQIILLLLGALNMTSPARADSVSLFLQFKYDLGEQSNRNLGYSFSVRVHEPAYNSIHLGPDLNSVITIPLYGNTSNHKTDRFYLNEEPQNFCQRSRVACVTLGAIIGAGAIYIFSESNKDFDSGNVEISINTKAERPAT